MNRLRPTRTKAERTRAPRGLSFLVGGYAMLGPFSISTYMPFFPVLMVSMGASQAELQQTLSAYLAAFGFMMLFHGPLSDAFGRRPIILVGLAAYFAASVGAALAGSLLVLLAFRTLQGLSVGAGSIVGRALVRDVLEGPAAQRVFSYVQMIFAVAPAVAPVLGGWLHNWFPWQSVFIFMAGFSLLLLASSYFYLPESLPGEERTSFRPRSLTSNYLAVLRSKPFWLLSIVLSFNFVGFFLYVSSAPIFVLKYLKLGTDDFGWLFIPATAGVMLGAYLSSKVAEKLHPARTVGYAYAVMFAACVLNVVYNGFLPPVVPWAVLPIMMFTIGMGLATPSITLLTLDLFPRTRGTVASLQGFLQTMVMTAVSALAPPLVGHSGFLMALTMSAFAATGCAAWLIYRRHAPLTA